MTVTSSKRVLLVDDKKNQGSSDRIIGQSNENGGMLEIRKLMAVNSQNSKKMNVNDLHYVMPVAETPFESKKFLNLSRSSHEGGTPSEAYIGAQNEYLSPNSRSMLKLAAVANPSNKQQTITPQL